ncbi:MAG TPA: hypothetical protein VKD22_01875, partial [Ramlibacter sp.]|nr:hypothetical protein [Ramlibacter sp.]
LKSLSEEIAKGMGGENVVTAMQIRTILLQMKDRTVVTTRRPPFTDPRPDNVYAAREIPMMRLCQPSQTISTGRRSERSQVVWLSVDFLERERQRDAAEAAGVTHVPIASGCVAGVLAEFFSHYNTQPRTVLTAQPVFRKDFEPALTDDEIASLRTQYSDMFGIVPISRKARPRILRREAYESEWINAVALRDPTAEWGTEAPSVPSSATLPLVVDIVTKFTMLHHERIGFAHASGLSYDSLCDPPHILAHILKTRADNPGVFSEMKEHYPLDVLKKRAEDAQADSMMTDYLETAGNPAEDAMATTLDSRAEKELAVMEAMMERETLEGVDWTEELAYLRAARAKRRAVDEGLPAPQVPTRTFGEVCVYTRPAPMPQSTGRLHNPMLSAPTRSDAAMVAEMCGTRAEDAPARERPRVVRAANVCAARLAASNPALRQRAIEQLRRSNRAVLPEPVAEAVTHDVERVLQAADAQAARLAAMTPQRRAPPAVIEVEAMEMAD